MRDLEFDIKGRDKTAAAFDSARANARQFNGVLDLTARGFNLSAMAAKGFAVGLATSALAEFGTVVRRMVSDAADLVDLSDRVSVSTDNIQRMTYGFGQAGVAAGDIDDILTQWAKRIGEAHTKGGQLAEVFRANNIALTDSEGRLRSSVELMRDYGNLIAGAGSDQERMTLATLAFGNAGEAMAVALRDGAEGMDRLMQSTDEAGGVLEDALLRRQAEIDDAFGRMWQNFETNSKSAILSAVAWLDDLRQGFDGLAQSYDARRKAADLGALAGSLAGTPRPDRGDRLPSGVDRRIDTAFAGAAPESDAATTRMLRDRFGPRTVIPRSHDLGDASSRTASASAAREQETAYQGVIDRLREEQDMLGLDATSQRILSEQRRAGVSAASEQGKAIEDVVRRIEAETDRLDKLEEQQREVNDAVKYLAGSALDGVLAWAQGAATAEDAARGLAAEIMRAVAYAALLGEGPLAGLFGGGATGGGSGGGGLVGLLVGAATKMLGGVVGGVGGAAADPWAGFRAEGGPVEPFKTYVVGEKGPELLRMGGRSGYVVPNSELSASSSGRSVNINFNVTSPDAPSFVKSRAQIETLMARAVARGHRGL